MLRSTSRSVPTPSLEELHIVLSEYGQVKLSEMRTIVKMLARTLERRATMGHHLERLVVSECLITLLPWEAYMGLPELRQIAWKADTAYCRCRSHNVASSSDGGDSEDED